MHVTKVELENIKAYERASFEFRRGTTAIVGHNGAGKTTILEAVAWALFDVLDYNKDDFLRRGAKKGAVRVTFESDLDNRQYTVVRDTGNGYFVHDPVLNVRLAEKKADVGQFLRQHLGLEPGTDVQSLFKSAIGVPQGTLTADFLKSATQRKSSFDRLLKVEEYREGAERLRETVNLIREKLSDVRVRIGNAEGKLARYDELKAEHQTFAERAMELTAALEELRAETRRRAESVEAFDAAERRVTETRAEAERARFETEAARRRLDAARAELALAESAVERRRATETDYNAHLRALEELREMEAERSARDRLRAEAEGNARAVVRAEAELRRALDALSSAERARLAALELEPQIEEQTSQEAERERLRDLLARARAAGEQVKRLDEELKVLRAQHAQTKERVKDAERGRDAKKRAENLESERLELQTKLSASERAGTARDHLRKQREQLARDCSRLRESIAKLERETLELEKALKGAERLSELERRERELVRDAARLRAEIARDEKMRAEVKNGLCPILSERCLNIGEGQTLEGYFADHLAANQTQLQRIESESRQIVEALSAARAAAGAAARFESERARLEQERALLAECEASLRQIETELEAAEKASADNKELRLQLSNVDAVLKTAHEAAQRFAGLEMLRAHLQEIEAEGKSKREARENFNAAANGAAELEREASAVEKRLRQLNDPRGRAAAFVVEASRAAALKIEEAKARAELSALESESQKLNDALARFADLDARWIQVSARRDATADAYREHIKSAALAATLDARAKAAADTEAEAARAARSLESAQAARDEAERSYDRDRHEEERVQLTLARERAATAKAQLDAAQERAAALAAELAKLDEVRHTLREEFREKERLEELNEATDFMRDILKQAGPIVTESYLVHISQEANQLFREITGDAARSLKWTRDYEIVLEENGYERSFINLSGGEQMAAALSIRLALLKQLSDIRLAFFDEPTVNMDAERRERLAQQIGQVRHFDQLFVISHDDTFEETADHVVNVARQSEAAMAS